MGAMLRRSAPLSPRQLAALEDAARAFEAEKQKPVANLTQTMELLYSSSEETEVYPVDMLSLQPAAAEGPVGPSAGTVAVPAVIPREAPQVHLKTCGTPLLVAQGVPDCGCVCVCLLWSVLPRSKTKGIPDARVREVATKKTAAKAKAKAKTVSTVAAKPASADNDPAEAKDGRKRKATSKDVDMEGTDNGKGKKDKKRAPMKVKKPDVESNAVIQGKKVDAEPIHSGGNAVEGKQVGQTKKVDAVRKQQHDESEEGKQGNVEGKAGKADGEKGNTEVKKGNAGGKKPEGKQFDTVSGTEGQDNGRLPTKNALYTQKYREALANGSSKEAAAQSARVAVKDAAAAGTCLQHWKVPGRKRGRPSTEAETSAKLVRKKT